MVWYKNSNNYNILILFLFIYHAINVLTIALNKKK